MGKQVEGRLESAMVIWFAYGTATWAGAGAVITTAGAEAAIAAGTNQ